MFVMCVMCLGVLRVRVSLPAVEGRLRKTHSKNPVGDESFNLPSQTQRQINSTNRGAAGTEAILYFTLFFTHTTTQNKGIFT